MAQQLPPSTPIILKIDEVAALFRISKGHARRLVRSGDLPAPSKYGRLHRWPREVVEAWMLRQAAPASQA